MVLFKILFYAHPCTYMFCEVHCYCFNRYKSAQIHVSGVDPKLTLWQPSDCKLLAVGTR